MQKNVRPAKVLLYQSAGFLAIITLSWVDEMVGFHKFLFGDHPYISDFKESTVEMLFVMAVWLLVAGSTRRLLAKVHYLGGFMKVCAWCRRIEQGGNWMPIEQFMEQGFDTPTTHGICDCCLEKAKAAANAVKEDQISDKSTQGCAGA